jgi:hypothetical protein
MLTRQRNLDIIAAGALALIPLTSTVRVERRTRR